MKDPLSICNGTGDGICHAGMCGLSYLLVSTSG